MAGSDPRPESGTLANEVFSRLRRGIGANLYGQAVVAFTQLVGVPILLEAWGTKTYGQWLIVFAIPGYLSMTDLGFSISAANDMTAQVAAGNRTEALAVFQSISALVALASVTALVVVASLIWILPIGRWLHLGNLEPSAVRLVVLLLSVEVIVKLFDGINHAGFRANGDYALHVTISNTTLLLQQLAVWSLALAGLGPLLAAVGYLAVRMCIVPAAALLLTSRYSWLRFGIMHARFAELRRLLEPATANLVFPFGHALNIQGMILAVGAALGPAAVVIFSTTRTISRLALQMGAVIAHAAEPEFAALSPEADGDTGPLRRLYVGTVRVALWLAIGTILLLAVFGNAIFHAWTRGAVSLHMALFLPLLLATFSSAVWNQAMTILKALNQHISVIVWYVVSATATVATAALLLHVTDWLPAAGISLFAFDVGYCALVLRKGSRLVGFSFTDAVIEAANPLALLRRRSKAVHGV